MLGWKRLSGCQEQRKLAVDNPSCFQPAQSLLLTATTLPSELFGPHKAHFHWYLACSKYFDYLSGWKQPSCCCKWPQTDSPNLIKELASYVSSTLMIPSWPVQTKPEIDQVIQNNTDTKLEITVEGNIQNFLGANIGKQSDGKIPITQCLGIIACSTLAQGENLCVQWFYRKLEQRGCPKKGQWMVQTQVQHLLRWLSNCLEIPIA